MATASLSDNDHDRISQAIREAEAATAGEIYVVIAHAADNFRYVPVIWAALAALLVPWPLYFFTPLSVPAILVIQAMFFIIVASVLSHPAIRHRIVPDAIAAYRARRNAYEQFLAHGVHLTEDRTGVLIYLALANRRVEIIADVGIHSKVGPAAWEELAREITSAARKARLVDGVLNAVRRAGAVLAQHFPPRPDNPNELSDRVVEI